MSAKAKAGPEKTVVKAIPLFIADKDVAAKSMLFSYFFNRGFSVDTAGDEMELLLKMSVAGSGIAILDAGFYPGKLTVFFSVIRKLAPGMKIVLISGQGCPVERIAEAREAGISFHSTKPINFDELGAVLGLAENMNGGE